MKDNVIIFPGETKLGLPVERVCDKVKEHCKQVLIIGTTHEEELLLATSLGEDEYYKLLYYLDMARDFLIRNVFGSPTLKEDD